MMLRKLLFLSFIEGAAVMAAELSGARLLAPVFGSSLFTWASVMGITLAALAGGYFFGGTLSSSVVKRAERLRQVLLYASLFLLLMPVLSHYLVPRISYLPFTPAIILSTLVLLLPPVFLLGASSPLFIQLQTRNDSEAGMVSGWVYAISTLGGIVSTFLCGFYLIPVAGLNFTMYLFGLSLSLSTLLIFGLKGINHVFLLLAVTYLNFQISRPLPVVFSEDGILGRLTVTEGVLKGDRVRYLKINDIIQSEMSLHDRNSVSAYVQLLDTLVPVATTGQQALVLGLGAGLTANMLEKKNYRTVGVEFDKRVIRAAKTYFFLSENVHTVHADARVYLNSCTQQYSIVLADLFKAEEQPSHVFTLESLQNLKHNLAPEAMVFITWHGFLEGERGLGTRILLHTLRRAGFNYQLLGNSGKEASRNLLILASPFPIHEKRFLLDEPVEPTTLVNSDFFPLLEKYNASANKAWRTQYLRYYQGQF